MNVAAVLCLCVEGTRARDCHRTVAFVGVLGRAEKEFAAAGETGGEKNGLPAEGGYSHPSGPPEREIDSEELAVVRRPEEVMEGMTALAPMTSSAPIADLAHTSPRFSCRVGKN